MRQIEPDGVTVRRIRPSEMTKSAGVGGMEGKSWAPRDVESAKDVCHFCLWSYGSNLLGNHFICQLWHMNMCCSGLLEHFPSI